MAETFNPADVDEVNLSDLAGDGDAWMNSILSDLSDEDFGA